FRSAHDGFDPALGDRQMHHRAITHVGPPARQAILEVAVALEVCTPRVAPEGRGDGSALDADRLGVQPFLGPSGNFPRGLGAPLGHGNIGLISISIVVVIVIPAHWSVPPFTNPINFSQRSPGSRPASPTAITYRCPFPSARLLPSLLHRSLRPRPGSSPRSSRRSVPRRFPGS